MVLEAIMFNAFSTTIGRSSRSDSTEPAEELWDLILHGVGRRGSRPGGQGSLAVLTGEKAAFADEPVPDESGGIYR